MIDNHESISFPISTTCEKPVRKQTWYMAQTPEWTIQYVRHYYQCTGGLQQMLESTQHSLFLCEVFIELSRIPPLNYYTKLLEGKLCITKSLLQETEQNKLQRANKFQKLPSGKCDNSSFDLKSSTRKIQPKWLKKTIGQVPFKQWDQVSKTIGQVPFTKQQAKCLSNNGTKCPSSHFIQVGQQLYLRINVFQYQAVNSDHFLTNSAFTRYTAAH